MIHSLLYIFSLGAANPPSQLTSNVLYVLGAFLAGGALTLIWNIYMRAKRGKVEDTELINRITQQTIEGADNILQQYRVEVEVVKRQVEDYRSQLHEVTRELARATLRITQLESDLKDANGQRERLERELQHAITEREHLKEEVGLLRKEIENRLRGK